MLLVIARYKSHRRTACHVNVLNPRPQNKLVKGIHKMTSTPQKKMAYGE